MNEKTIQELTSYSSLDRRVIYHNQYQNKNKILLNPYSFINSTVLVGLEIEIENIRELMYPDYYWKEIDDHSLRNNGKEYVSIPLRTKQIPYAIEYLLKELLNKNPDFTFSNRCSLHVHLNVRDFTLEQLQVFLILYCIFENHFFNIAGTKRQTNIFCIPLWKTETLPNTRNLANINSYNYWNKYNALNCGCIFGSEDNAKLGTIEFRHLYGTVEPKIIYNWIDTILILRKESLNYTKEEIINVLLSIKNKNDFYIIYKNIFNSFSLPYETITKNYQKCIYNTKLNLFNDLTLRNLFIPSNSFFYSPN